MTEHTGNLTDQFDEDDRLDEYEIRLSTPAFRAVTTGVAAYGYDNDEILDQVIELLAYLDSQWEQADLDERGTASFLLSAGAVDTILTALIGVLIGSKDTILGDYLGVAGLEEIVDQAPQEMAHVQRELGGTAESGSNVSVSAVDVSTGEVVDLSGEGEDLTGEEREAVQGMLDAFGLDVDLGGADEG